LLCVDRLLRSHTHVVKHLVMRRIEREGILEGLSEKEPGSVEVLYALRRRHDLFGGTSVTNIGNVKIR
jgi:hypothetical protein